MSPRPAPPPSSAPPSMAPAVSAHNTGCVVHAPPRGAPARAPPPRPGPPFGGRGVPPPARVGRPPPPPPQRARDKQPRGPAGVERAVLPPPADHDRQPVEGDPLGGDDRAALGV